MGIYKLYFDKCNTIIKGSEVNTANNPVSELAYGSRTTRLLFDVDLDILRTKVANKELNLTNARHLLKVKATVDFATTPYLGDYKNILVDDATRPVSFDMELHALAEAWDAGNGYDFGLNAIRRAEDMDYVTTASNWIQATTLTDWDNAGALPTGTTAIATQHFDKGNEDIVMDITDYINNLLTTTGSTHQGFCLKYADEFENLGGSKQYVTGFFTKTTQTFFEPYIETVFDDVIKDDRNKFFLNKVNRLYLYVNVGGKLTNLDALPACTITGVPGLTVVHQSKGIYYVEFLTEATDFVSYKKYYDTWTGLTVNGIDLSDVRMSFIPKDESEYYQLNDEMVLPQHYGVSLSGILQEEKISSGEMRRINVLVRKPYTVNQNDVVDDIYYRVYVKVGTTHLTVVDWSDVSRSNIHNFFTLDTSWMIPNKYYVDIKINQNGESLLYNDKLVFTVVSRKNS